MNNNELREKMRQDLEELDQVERRRLKKELEKRMAKTWDESVQAARGDKQDE